MPDAAADSARIATFFSQPIGVHDEPELRAVPAEIVHEFAPGSFVENLAALDDGLLISIHNRGEIVRWRSGGAVEIVARTPSNPAGIVVRNGYAYVCGGAPGATPGFVWRLDLTTNELETFCSLPGARFPNGMTALNATRLLVADSIVGAIFAVDLDDATAHVWSDDPLLRKGTLEPTLPGANGIKVFGADVFVTITDAAVVIAVPIDPDGSAGAARVHTRRLRGDDFAFDTAGSAYIATHIHNGIVRLDRDGTRLGIGGLDQGLAGSTAVAFGTGAADASCIYVTTTGGVYAPPPAGPGPAKLVRLEVGRRGAPLPIEASRAR